MTVDKDDLFETIKTFFKNPEEFKTYLSPFHKFAREAVRSQFIAEGMNFEDINTVFVFEKIMEKMTLELSGEGKSSKNEIKKYLLKIEKDYNQVLELYKFMGIHLSNSFNEFQKYEEIKRKLIPERNIHKDGIKVLIVGVGSGEELATIALIFYDLLSKKEIKNNYLIYGFDKNANVIKNIKKGGLSFSPNLKNKIPNSYHQYLDIRGDFFSLKSEVLENVIFSKDDFLNRSLISFDFSFCENVLKPYKSKVREEIILKNALVLDTRGYLVIEDEYLNLSKYKEYFLRSNLKRKGVFELNKKVSLEVSMEEIKRRSSNLQKKSIAALLKNKKAIHDYNKKDEKFYDKDSEKTNFLVDLIKEKEQIITEHENLKNRYNLTKTVLNSAVSDFRKTFEKQEQAKKELQKAYDEISKMKEELEVTVKERTSQLHLANMQLVKTNEALLKSNKAYEKIQSERLFFFANLSHELRTPLNAILGFSKILQEVMEFEDWDEREQSYVDAINISGRSLLRLVNSVHDFTKIELNELKVVEKKCNLKNVFKPISLHFKNECKRKGLNFILEISEELPQWIISDELLIKQVLDNLLSNAIKFTKLGHIKLKAECNEKNDKKGIMNLIIKVEDTGIGMPNEKLDKIFHSFSQVHKRESVNERGSGLGLYISNEIINVLKGEIFVSSELNKGTLFTIILKDIAFSKEKIEKGELLYSFQGSKVLIADDFRLNLQLYEAYLSTHNLKIETALNGKELVDKTETFKPDLIVTDYDMPILNAYEALNILRGNGIQVPMLLISALKVQDDIINKFDSFLRKPIEREALLSEIAKFLNHQLELFASNEEVKQEKDFDLDIPKEFKVENKEIIVRLNKMFLMWKNSMELTAIEKDLKKLKKEIRGTGLDILIPFLDRLEEAASNFKINIVINLLNKGIEATKNIK